ncbi:hypothetical protein LIER_04098 [Lithospermum erythrorhizon]|uniref:Uncharacterized protein n=1 Tax=Lithospermum erythrorhizon TaxID=34254 RepID=A0AAV3NZP7_LITER
MGDSQNSSLFRNHCILHLQKLTLELKCPLCFNLLNNPVVFPCNHIFCNDHVARSEQDSKKCPTCELQCLDQEVRSAPYMENIVRLCQSLEETVNAAAYQPSFVEISSKHSPSTLNKHCNSRKTHPSEIPQKRIYAVEHDDSVNSNKGETDSKKFKPEQVHHSSNCVIIIDDDDDNVMIEEEPQSEDCKASEHCEHAIIKEEPQIEDCEVVEVCEKIVVEEEPQTAEGNINWPDRNSPVLKDVSDMGLVDNHSEVGGANHHNTDGVQSGTSFTWSARKKRKTLVLREVLRVREESRHILKSTKHCLVPHSSPLSKTVEADKLVCAFCHSSEENEGTGKLLGFADKKEINLTSISDFSHTKVLIGHRKCVYWSPKVFFNDGNCIQNLESEVTRAAKLKCQSCGKKGAGLGCFLESCRKTYHVPCAFFTPQIRWDCKNYLMLCPSHVSCKFPGEMFESENCSDGEKHPSPSKITSERSNLWAKDLVLCGSDLSEEDKTQLDNFATTCGVNVSQSWNQNVTHVIASTDATGACIQTFEYLMAILNGKWIVKFDWLKACIEANRLLDELDYAFRPDSYCYGPERGRLRVSKNGPKLFAGLRFSFFGDFEPTQLNQLLELVEAAGGVVESKEMLANNAGAAPRSRFLVFNCTPPQGNPTGDMSFLHQRLSEVVDVMVDIGVGIISQKWILDSIAGHKLLPCV